MSKKIVYTALFTALTAALTLFPRIPSGLGYINLGDAVIIVSCVVIGRYAIVSAAVGAALADLIGYPVYAPATLVIKGAMALALCAISGKRNAVWLFVAGAFAAELIMSAGYFLFEGLFYGGFGVAVVGIPANLVQAAAALLVGVPVAMYFRKRGTVVF